MAVKFVKYHLPCPSCGSSDALSVNEDASAKCFSCNKFFPKFEEGGQYSNMKTVKTQQPLRAINVEGGCFSRLVDRGISQETAKTFGVKVVYSSDGKVAQHLYPFYINNEISAIKTRYVNDKRFTIEGTIQGTGLFGQNLFKAGGKYITITEGECDAMAVYEMTGSKWPVVSIKTGVASAVRDIKDNIEYLESFDNVIICFDKDKAGIEASKKVASILKPLKAKIVNLPNGYKDANDMLLQNKHQDFVKAWWDAKIFTPSGIIRVSEKETDFFNRPKKDSTPYPYEGLNKKLIGMRQGELVTITGGTGLGKSSVTRELEHWLINKTDDNVGIIALEEDWRRTVDGVMSIEANARLYIDSVRETFTFETLRTMYQKLFGKDKVFIHAHFGTNDIEDIFSKLRYLIVGCDCKWVVVDHLHMLVTALSENDERRGIDNIMTRLRSMVEETGAGIFLVSHLRRVDGNKGHENGIQVNLSHLRGSQSIAQLSDCVIALERNQQAEDEREAQTTRLRVLKSRYTGDVGMACALLYDKDTGRLEELDETDFSSFDSKMEPDIPF